MEVDELAKLDFVIKTVGSLPLLRDFVARMGFADLIDTHCPLAAQAELSCGTVAELLVANRLQAPKPLYKVEHWAREVGVEDVFGIPPELLNDDRLGRMVELLGQQGPMPIYYEPLDGNASGYQVTLANITHLKQQLQLDRIIRINDRGCQIAKILAHSLAHGFDTIAPITWKNTIEKLVRATLAAGTALQPLAYVPVSQQQKDPDQRDGYSAFEIPYQVYYKHRVYPVRLIVVKSEGKVKRIQKVRQRHRAWIEERLKQLRARVGQPRWTKRRINNNIRKALKQYPEGQWYKVTLLGFGKHAQELRVEVDEAKMQAATQWDGMYALVTTLRAEEYSTDRVFGLFKEQHYVERSNHILKGQLRISPIYLKKPIRIEGLLFILWLALVAYLLLERQYRNHTKVPKQKRRTTRSIFEVFEGYAWVLIKVPEGYYRRPSALTADQQEIYTALELNPP